MSKLLLTAATAFALTACSFQTTTTETPSDSNAMSLEYKKYTLDNGLDVVLHIDKSDPVVAVNLAAKVGSAREKPGRTGFAHLFEHLLFLDSENLGFSGLDQLATRIGGSGSNGYTSYDITTYFQSAPSDSLEKLIWTEAEKIGFFINTVTQDVIDNEREVVKNEKRQQVDNQPYGFNFEVISENLYAPDHPYHWPVLGSLEDLQAATLEDVHEFYKTWYVPNNVTLTIAGDIDADETLALVKKYFSEIPRGADIPVQEPRPAILTENKSFYHEDHLANLPVLTMVWPTVPDGHKDTLPLSVLGTYLSFGNDAPLSVALVDDLKLTTSVAMFGSNYDLAGQVEIQISANDGVDLDSLIPGIERAFETFSKEGIPQKDLDRIVASIEVDTLGGLDGVLGKAIQLAENNIFYDNPGYTKTQLERYRSITTQDVKRVFNEYILGKPYLTTSFVPEGKVELALEGSVDANVKQEETVTSPTLNTNNSVPPGTRSADFKRTPSSIDRSVEPPFQGEIEMPVSTVWRDKLDNGIDVYGIKNDELPLVYFSFEVDAGHLKGDYSNPIIPRFTGSLLQRGTANKTPGEFEVAMEILGSQIGVTVGNYTANIQGSTLARNFDETIALVEEMLMEPRWDEGEYEEIIQSRKNRIASNLVNPNFLAGVEASKITHPEGSLLSISSLGTLEQVEATTISDLKRFYNRNFKPEGGNLIVVGDIDAETVKSATASLTRRWTGKPQDSLELPSPNPVERSVLYVYDYPKATQSTIRAWRPSIKATHPDYPLLDALNFNLGGAFTSILNDELRVKKGYTYGIGSSFFGDKYTGTFSLSTSVRSDVTIESIESIKEIVENYGPEFSEEDLTLVKDSLIRSQALQTESLAEKFGLLNEISGLGYPDDYLMQHADLIKGMSLEEFKEYASKYIRPEALNWMVVGNVKSDMEKFRTLGFDDVILLNK